MKYLTEKLGKWMPSGHVKVDGKPRLSGIMDTVNATKAHDPAYLSNLGVKESDKPGWDVFPVGRTQVRFYKPRVRLPPEFYDAKATKLIEKMIVDEWFNGFQESQEYRMLGIGSLMGDVVERMVRTAEWKNIQYLYDQRTAREPGQQTSLRLSLNGCHDTTIAAIVASLGAYDMEKWPGFTGHVVLELFRDPSVSSCQGSGDGNDSSTRKPAGSHDMHQHTGAIEKLEHILHLHSHSSAPIGRRKMEALTEEERKRIKGYYVRLRYNDEPMKIPGCKPRENHWRDDEGLCTLVSASRPSLHGFLTSHLSP